MQRLRSLWVAVQVVSLAIWAAAAVPAYAWSFSAATPSTLYLAREASDTATATILVYRYGGSPTAGQLANGDYAETQTVTDFFYPVRSGSATLTMVPEVRFVSYPALPPYSHLIAIAETGQRWFLGPSTAAPVYIAVANGTAPGTMTVAPYSGATFPVSFSATASVVSSGSVAVSSMPDAWNASALYTVLCVCGIWFLVAVRA